MEARPLSDEALVRRLLPNINRDPADRAVAWEEWYSSIGVAPVMAFIRATNNTPEADGDILQDAMVTAYTEIERGRYEPRIGIPFTAYIKGIARNKIREARRRTRHYIYLEDTAEPFDAEERRLEKIVERREQQRVMSGCVAGLPDCRREVVEAYLNGHSTEEIAERLGISEALVRQHKCRGLRKLRTQIETPPTNI